jgi:hypothetical protein
MDELEPQIKQGLRGSNHNSGNVLLRRDDSDHAPTT